VSRDQQGHGASIGEEWGLLTTGLMLSKAKLFYINCEAELATLGKQNFVLDTSALHLHPARDLNTEIKNEH
jgi:hypothetical protein